MTSKLRDARRSRGWSQARLIAEIEHRLKGGGRLRASSASLKVYVSEWENSRRAVSPEYREVLRAIYGLTDLELFDSAAEPVGEDAGRDELLARISRARGVDRSVAVAFAAQTELFRSMDRQLGAPPLVDSIAAHLATLQDSLAHAVLANARAPLARALSEAATLAGWQALDVGATQRAWTHYETARVAAADARAPALVAHAMGEQAYVLVDLGLPDLAAGLLAEALTAARGRAPARLRAWLHAAQAELHAIAGDSHASRTALELAHEALPSDGEDRDAEVPGVILNTSHLTRWRGHSLALLGDDDAVGELHAALARMDATFTRAEAGLRSDLAQAHLVRGEVDEAQRQARTARQLASRTGSVRHLRRIDRLGLT